MYITCEWHQNHPLPDPQQVAAKVKSLFDGRRAVSVVALAKLYGVNVGAMQNVLESAAQQGLVHAVNCQGWIPNGMAR